MVCPQDLEMIQALLQSRVWEQRQENRWRKKSVQSYLVPFSVPANSTGSIVWWGFVWQQWHLQRGLHWHGESFISKDRPWKTDPWGSQYVGATWWAMPQPQGPFSAELTAVAPLPLMQEALLRPAEDQEESHGTSHKPPMGRHLGFPEKAAELSMHAQCPGRGPSYRSSWGTPALPGNLCWEQLQALCCLGRQFGAGSWLDTQNTWQGALLHWTFVVGTVTGWEGECRAGGRRRRLETAPQNGENFILSPQQTHQGSAVPIGVLLWWPRASEPGCLCSNDPYKYFFLL